MSQLDRQRARRSALIKRAELERTIAESDARPAEKALMQQMVAHLWDHADKAMGGVECRP